MIVIGWLTLKEKTFPKAMPVTTVYFPQVSSGARFLSSLKVGMNNWVSYKPAALAGIQIHAHRFIARHAHHLAMEAQNKFQIFKSISKLHYIDIWLLPSKSGLGYRSRQHLSAPHNLWVSHLSVRIDGGCIEQSVGNFVSVEHEYNPTIHIRFFFLLQSTWTTYFIEKNIPWCSLCLY